MRIQHNIMAMNAYRNYNTNNSALSKNLEKLSSGYAINRAGDDAAGLAISEKMRAQITGLDTAQKNAKDGVSLVQTAEGALTEVHDMLNRMVELATQSANGTYEDETDRAQLQKEIEQLTSEIDRIADSANFNGINLLDGNLSGSGGATNVSVAVVNAEVQSATAVKGSFEIDFSNIVMENTSTTSQAVTVSVAGKNFTVTVGSGTVEASDIVNAIVAANTGDIAIGGLTFTMTGTGDGLKFEMKEDPSSADVSTWNGLNFDVSVSGTDIDYNKGTIAVTNTVTAVASEPGQVASGEFSLGSVSDGTQITIGNQTFTFAVGEDSKYKDLAGTGNYIDLTAYETTDTDFGKIAAQALAQNANGKVTDVIVGYDGSNITLTASKDATTLDDYNLDKTDGSAWKGFVKKADANASGGLVLQIGDTSDSFNQLRVSIQDMHSDKLGIDTIDISDQDGAQAAIEVIKNAINTVSDVRGTLGATQNRLDHTMNNLSVMEENITDAESTIRDTDIAEEMMAYTKNNILVQSAQAMLAQANQVPQGVLQLLG